MTKRSPVSYPQNIWFNAEQVDDDDLSLEQTHNGTIQSSHINNHIGTGVLPQALEDNIVFDSSLTTGFLDAVAIYAQNQPTDNNYGNQLEISLTNSLANIKKTVKVAVFGLDFNSELQYETFVFKTNEAQVTRKHYSQVLLLLTNDLIGDPNFSFNLGGRLVVKEARPMELSRDVLMVSQDVQPNLFFRDFFIDGVITLQTFLTNALPLYNIDTLNITTAEKDKKIILTGDVVTQIGQKFLATTSNIQKISVCLSVRNTVPGMETDLHWNGDLVMSIYQLQSNLDCPTDIAPNLEIDFPPTNIPIIQLSFDYTTLLDSGVLLDGVSQPIDFVFSNTPVAIGNTLQVGKYYAFTLKRSGAANKCDIMIATGADTTPDSRVTLYAGTVWVDLPEEDLWFRIYTDSAKVADGQGYDVGNGITVNKTNFDETSQATLDYVLDGLQFSGDDSYKAIVFADVDENTPIPDQRTGLPVNSRKNYVPQVKLLNSIDVANLQTTTDPLFLGMISDKNKKFYDAISSTVNANLYSASIVNNDLLIRIVTDTTDVVRFDTSVSTLANNIYLGDLFNAKFYPDTGNPTDYYRIAEAKVCSMVVGDVDGNGIVDVNDLDLLNEFIGFNLNIGLRTNTLITTVGPSTTFANGYTTLTKPFLTEFGLTFRVVHKTTNVTIASGTDGALAADPNNHKLANFTSSSVNFALISPLGDYNLVVYSANTNNNGGFPIIGIDLNVITIRKVYLNSSTIEQMFRADIDSDFVITSNDGYLLSSYIDRLPLDGLNFPAPNPAPTTDQYAKIGSRFDVIKIKLEKFVDRTDDYWSTGINRSTVVHPSPDVFLDNPSFDLHNFYTSPVPMSINKLLSWDESLVVTTSNPKQVTGAFVTNSGYEKNSCEIDGIVCNVYPAKPAFDPGRVDYYFPNNVVIDKGGQLKNPDGSFHKVDFEVGTIVLEIPNGLFGDEKTISIFDDFMVDYEGGITRFGFPAMKFADCSYVQSDSLTKDQVRFSVAVQSFSPNTNGLDNDGYSGIIVDGKMGVSVNYETGSITINFTNLYQDPVFLTMSTKVEVQVFLKKGGFNNVPLFVDSKKMRNMLELVSVFNIPIDLPNTLVDLATDVTGVLPIIHGGTGTATPIVVSTGAPDGGKFFVTDSYAGKVDTTFYYKNPVYIYGTAGLFTSTTLDTIGALTFRFDSFILNNISSIKFEAIIKKDGGSTAVHIQLKDLFTSNYVTLSGANDYLNSVSTSYELVRSDDIKLSLQTGALDYLYQVDLSVVGTGTVYCTMARLVLTYNNTPNNSIDFQTAPPP